MIIERKFNTKLKSFDKIKQGTCFEIPWDVNGEYIVDFSPKQFYMKIEPTMIAKTPCRVPGHFVNAVDLKTGKLEYIDSERLVIEEENAEIIIS